MMTELNKTAEKRDTLWMSNRLDGDGNSIEMAKKIDYQNS